VIERLAAADRACAASVQAATSASDYGITCRNWIFVTVTGGGDGL